MAMTWCFFNKQKVILTGVQTEQVGKYATSTHVFMFEEFNYQLKNVILKFFCAKPRH